jgi:hypothetical protein
MFDLQDWINYQPGSQIVVPEASIAVPVERQPPDLGWTCIDVEDLGADGSDYIPGVCEKCGNDVLRFLHTLEHPDWPEQMVVGCICASRMCEGYDGRGRETELKNLAIRRSRWLTRNWRESRKGNEFLNLKGYNLGVFPDSRHPGKWNWWIIKGNYKRYGDGPYPSSDHAKMRLFDYLTKPASTPSA